MPVYNCKKYIREAVDSVLKQPYQRIRLILIDDGSTDGTSPICDDLELAYNERVSVIHQANMGVSAARNTGIKHVLSKNEKIGKDCYFAFLDADDKWVDSFFESQLVDFLRSGFDLLGFQSCRCNETITRRNNPIALEAGEHDGGVAALWLRAGQHLGATLYSVDFIRRYNLKFYEIKASEDKIFIMQCLYLANKVHLENKLMYLYRQTNSSAVHTRDTGIKYFKPIIDAYLKSDEEMQQWSNGKREILSEGKELAGIYVMDLIDDYYQHGGSREMLDAFLEKNPLYERLASCNVAVSKRWKQMRDHLLIYKSKNRIYGILFSLMKRIYYVRPVKNVIDIKRFPVRL